MIIFPLLLRVFENCSKALLGLDRCSMMSLAIMRSKASEKPRRLTSITAELSTLHFMDGVLKSTAVTVADKYSLSASPNQPEPQPASRIILQSPTYFSKLCANLFCDLDSLVLPCSFNFHPCWFRAICNQSYKSYLKIRIAVFFFLCLFVGRVHEKVY